MENTQDRPRRRLWQIMAAVGGMTAIVSLVAAGKDLFVAGWFGVSDQMDAFVLASMVPLFISSVVGYSFNAALIPTYISERETKGQDAAQRLLSTTLVWGILLLIGISLVLALIVPVLISLIDYRFTPEKMALTKSLFFILLATIVLRGTMVIYGAVLNAHERYRLVSLSPMLTPLCIVAAVLITKRIGVYALAWGTVVGMLLEMIVLGYGLARSRISILPRWHGYTEPAKMVVKQYMPMIAGACLSSGTTVVSQTCASTLGPGSLSVLSYASKIVGFWLFICATAVSTAVMPHFCTLASREDWPGIRHAVSSNMRIIAVATFAITAVLYFGSDFIVSILFQRGEFGAADTVIVSRVQRMYILQLPFYVAVTMLLRLISSLRGNSILLWGAALNLAVSVILNWVLMRRMGVPGIALSCAGVHMCSLVFCWIALNKRIKRMSLDGASKNDRSI